MLPELFGVDPLDAADLTFDAIFVFADPPLETDNEDDGRGTGFVGEFVFRGVAVLWNFLNTK